MPGPALAETGRQIEAAYRRRTPKSAALHGKAQKVMPGGDTRSSTFFGPYPVVIERGEGPRLQDVDGNVYLDFLNNYTSLIHGHAFPPVVEALRRQAELGSAWAAPNERQIRLATLIAERVASVEQLRFTNSGTEATLLALRAARAFTGRDLVIKIEGGYHGSHDFVSVSVGPDLALAGPPDAPLAVPDGPGLARGTLESTLVVPFNNAAALERALAAHAGQVAAVIVEPVMGSAGFIAAAQEYLAAVRRLTQAHGVVLILDEVMSFRLDTGGAQALYDIRPDLTTFAKIIGGGLPVGAFGGRADLMQVFDPVKGSIHHGGTFNANPMTAAGGLAAMEALTPERIAHANRLGDALREGLEEVLAEQGVAGQVTGRGSLAGIHLAAGPVTDYRGAAAMPGGLRRTLHLACLNHGLFMSPGGLLNTSTVMSLAEVNQAAQAFQEALVELRPALESEFPGLLR